MISNESVLKLTYLKPLLSCSGCLFIENSKPICAYVIISTLQFSYLFGYHKEVMQIAYSCENKKSSYTEEFKNEIVGSAIYRARCKIKNNAIATR